MQAAEKIRRLQIRIYLSESIDTIMSSLFNFPDLIEFVKSNQSSKGLIVNLNFIENYFLTPAPARS